MRAFYTGVGSRETPDEVLRVMNDIAKQLARKEVYLRSGGADGADRAFEAGCDSVDPKLKEIYIPWAGFNGHDPKDVGYMLVKDKHILERASTIAKEIHPAWDRLSRGAQALHARNVFQVLGRTMDYPSLFLICYAQLDRNGQPRGGTRTAIKLAEKHNVPVYNLYVKEHFDRVHAQIAGI